MAVPHLLRVERPRRALRRRNRTRWFLAITSQCAVEVDGVTLIGCRGSWHVDATPYRVVIEDEQHWWLFGGDVNPAVECVDPHDAIAILRRRGLIPGAAS